LKDDPAPTEANFLKRPSTSDVVVWTGGSDPSPLGAGDVGVHCPSGLQKMLILLLAVLLSWPHLL